MFSFLKKKEIYFPSDYFPIAVDIHSHILPGIDDGSPNIETSLELINGLMKLGINQSIATPHIISDLFKNNQETIFTSLNLLKKALTERGMDFEVSAAAEYMLDSYFFELLEKKEPLLTLFNTHVLTEFSYAFAPYDINKMAFDIIQAGYKPILAHPERYSYFHSDYKMYHKLNDYGFLLQMNLLSLTGHYGKETMKAAEYLINNNLLAYVATDLHHPAHLNLLKDKKNIATFYKHLSHRPWNEIGFIK